MIYLTDGKRHLISYPFSVQNLHAMAKDLGIKRCWYHSSKYPHYDIPKKRKKEIEDRCFIIETRDILKIIKGEEMTNEIKGYVKQSSENVAKVNRLKEAEERILRIIDELNGDETVDKRWLATGKTEIEKGFMAVNRSVFQPKRIDRLPEDD
jgi:hypothetical protein